MLTIDELLFKIENHGLENLNGSVPIKDLRILKNIAKMVKLTSYITENQGKLLVKILQENFEALNFIGPALIPSIKNPTWLKTFKTIDTSRKISIAKSEQGTSLIDIEFSFDKNLKKDISAIQKIIEGNVNHNTGRHYRFLLTEKNLHTVVTQLKKHNFDLTPQISAIFQEITNFDQENVKSQFNVDSTQNVKMRKVLEDDIGSIDTADYLMLQDRKIKYQYTLPQNLVKKCEKSLISMIAHRTNNKIFVDNSEHKFINVLQSIVDLKKLPLLIILDEYDQAGCIKTIKLLKNSLDSIGIDPNVGVYFRFHNSGEGAEFNQLIGEYGYNKQLNSDNMISVISNGKLPKFFLKTDWYPNSTISFSNHFRNNKSSIYCNECDLIVYYSNNKPLIGTVDAVV